MKDAIIVGFGLAGFHYALELQKHKCLIIGEWLDSYPVLHFMGD